MWRHVRLLTLILGLVGMASGKEVLRVGVQASSQLVVDSMYGPIFEGKFAKLNYTVNSTALTTDAAIYAAIQADGFDVFYGGPTIYNCLQSQYGLRGIAAGIDIENSEETPYLGAEMVARTTSGIKNISQMHGIRVALTQLTHEVGCLAQWGEMRKNGLDLFVDTKAVILANTSQNVLNAIATGVADVGFLRSGTVEQQTQKGLYKDGTFQTVNELDVSFPWPVSTPLYPAILIAVSKSVSDDISTRLAESLFEEDELSLQANISRWVPLQDYVPIQSLQVQLGVMFGDLSQCYRVASYYDSIVCPGGYYKQDRTRLESSCNGILECPRDLYTCICGPCLKVSSKSGDLKKWF
jgi:ABC-type phosphate/phosphonate transport system substrate-binding protein